VLEVLCCIRFRHVQGVELSFAYVQPSLYKMVRRAFPRPTRGAATTLTLGGFPPFHTSWYRVFPCSLPIYITHYAYM
jgi:hypothetical protein